jgi:hypothetical protein
VALLTIRGRLVLESAGPDWHLVGVVKRDKMRPNQLTLSRRRDAPWAKFTGLPAPRRDVSVRVRPDAKQ